MGNALLAGLVAGGAAGYAKGVDMQEKVDAGKRAQESHDINMENSRRELDKRNREEAVYADLANLVDQYSGNPKKPAAPAGPEPVVAQPGVDRVGLPRADGPALGAAPLTGAAPASPGLIPSTAEAVAAPATPATPAGPVDQAAAPGLVRPDATDAVNGPKTADERISFGLFSNPTLFNDPKFLNSAAELFLKNKMPEGVKWLEKGYAAQKENGLTAMQLLIAGQPQDAISNFNAGGKMKVTDAQPLEGGKWRVTMEGGKTTDIDPRAVLRSHIDPKAAMELDIKDRDTTVKEKTGAAQAKYYGAHADQVSAAARLTNAQAGNLEAGLTKDGKTPGAGGKPDKPAGKENLPVHKEFMDLAEKEFGEFDAMSGKYVLKGPALNNAVNRAAIASQVFEGSNQMGATTMDHATAFAIAMNGAVVKDAVFKGADGRYGMAPAVRYQDKVYILGGHQPVDVTDRVLAAQNKKKDAPAKPADARPTAPAGAKPAEDTQNRAIPIPRRDLSGVQQTIKRPATATAGLERVTE